MSIKLINNIEIPNAHGVKRGAFKAETRDLINILHLPASEAHTLDIQRVHGGVITLKIDNNESSLVTNPDVLERCETILRIADRFLVHPLLAQERAPLGGRAPSPTITDPAPRSETSPSEERASSPSSSEGNEEADRLRNEITYMQGRMDAMNEFSLANPSEESDAEAEVRTLRSDLASLDPALEALETRINNLTNQRLRPLEEESTPSQQNAELEALRAEFLTTAQESTKVIQDLQRCHDTLRSENEVLKARNAKQEPLIHAAQEQVELLKRDLQAKDQINSAMSQAQAVAIDKLLLERAEFQELYAALQKRTEEFMLQAERDKAILQSNLQATMSQAILLEQRLNEDKALKRRNTKIAEKNDDSAAPLTKRIKELERDLANAQQKVKDHKAQLEQLNVEAEKHLLVLHGVAEKYATGNRRMKASIDTLLKDNTQLALKLEQAQQLERDVDELTQEKYDLQAQLDTVQARATIAEEQLAKFKAAGLSARGMTQAEKESLRSSNINTAGYRLYNIYYAKTKDFLTDEQQRKLGEELVDTMIEQNLTWDELDEQMVYDEIIKPYFESLAKQGSDESA